MAATRQDVRALGPESIPVQAIVGRPVHFCSAVPNDRADSNEGLSFGTKRTKEPRTRQYGIEPRHSVDCNTADAVTR